MAVLLERQHDIEFTFCYLPPHFCIFVPRIGPALNDTGHLKVRNCRKKKLQLSYGYTWHSHIIRDVHMHGCAVPLTRNMGCLMRLAGKVMFPLPFPFAQERTTDVYHYSTQAVKHPKHWSRKRRSCCSKVLTLLGCRC